PVGGATALEHCLLRVNCLKRLGRYREAIHLLNQLLLSDDRRQEETILSHTEMSQQELIDLRDSIRRLAARTGAHSETDPQQPGEPATSLTRPSNLSCSQPAPFYSYQLDPRCRIVASP